MTNLEHARRRQGLTQTAAAARSSLNQCQVSAIERGRMIPTSEQRERLARALRIPAESLLDEVEERDSAEVGAG